MNRIALLLTCLLITSTVFAAEKPHEKKKLKDVPIVSAQKTVVKPWEPTAFVQDGERLPGGYAGLDPKNFLAMFKSKVDGLKKGEFETSEEFAQRTANKDALLTPINTSDLYAFRIKYYLSIKYDADAQVYSIGSQYGYSCKDALTVKDWVTCKVDSVSSEEDTYTGSNAYGASLTVTRKRGCFFALAIPKSSSLLRSMFSQERDSQNTYTYQDKISVPLEKARNLKDMEVAVLFVGRVSDTRIVEGFPLLISPTIDSPSDYFITEDAVPFALKKIIYYVVKTGEILGQKDF